jgi:hypothetical protein
MDALNFLDNFPWNRFAHVYENNAKDLKDIFIKILNGSAESTDYKYIIDRAEHQATLYRITPWILKIYVILLNEEKTDKVNLLQNIETILESANYNNQVDVAMKYKPTRGNLEKYTHIKTNLFDDAFNGEINDSYLKLYKSIDRNFMQIMIIEYISQKKIFFESFMQSKDQETSKAAIKLVNTIDNPKQYDFKI